MKLGVAFAWHVHPWEQLLGLVQRAEALGYDTAFVDGDISMLERRRESDVLDGWTATVALLARTERIRIGSIRLVHHWNAARLAQAVATVERLFPGRLHFLIAAGDRPGDERFGLPSPPAAERVRWLGETLAALRALWRGEAVTQYGEFVRLDDAVVRPTPPGGQIPIAVAGKGPKVLDLIAAHADSWDINLPPLPSRVEAAGARLAQACAERGRDPAEIRRSLWIFTRVADLGPDAALRAYRGLNPWFHWIPDDEIRHGWVVGNAADCRNRLEGLAEELRLELPVVDLSGVPEGEAHRVLEALAPD